MTSYDAISTRRLERISGLSDALFAIAMTIIVLEIHVPDPANVQTNAQLWDALGDLGPHLFVYAASFLTLGIFWGAQQTQLNQFAGTDRDLTWIHLLFLAAVAMMPFSTLLLSTFETLQVALIVYWVNLLALGLVLYLSWAYATHAGLLKPDVTPGIGQAIRRRVIASQLLYAICVLLSAIDTGIAITAILVVQVSYVIGPRLPGLSRI
jgi:uncharacterized membrane protein